MLATIRDAALPALHVWHPPASDHHFHHLKILDWLDLFCTCAGRHDVSCTGENMFTITHGIYNSEEGNLEKGQRRGCAASHVSPPIMCEALLRQPLPLARVDHRAP